MQRAGVRVSAAAPFLKQEKVHLSFFRRHRRKYMTHPRITEAKAKMNVERNNMTPPSKGSSEMSEPVERVAKAIADRIEAEEALPVPMWPAIARTAIAAMREPTPEMIKAANEEIKLGGGAFDIWRSMIDEMLK
jgi:hypothetical protein